MQNLETRIAVMRLEQHAAVAQAAWRAAAQRLLPRQPVDEAYGAALLHLLRRCRLRTCSRPATRSRMVADA